MSELVVRLTSFLFLKIITKDIRQTRYHEKKNIFYSFNAKLPLFYNMQKR